MTYRAGLGVGCAYIEALVGLRCVIKVRILENEAYAVIFLDRLSANEAPVQVLLRGDKRGRWRQGLQKPFLR